MKKIFLSLFAVGMMLTGCDDKLDLTPRKMSVLQSVDDIAAVLNQEWRIYENDYYFEVLAGNIYPYWSTPSEIFNRKHSEVYAYTFGDESVDRVGLCEQDYRYSEIYENIKFCNIVLSQLPDADGDERKKTRVLAQAHVLRAWFHFLAVNMFAAQYDEATAATTGGVAFVDNTNNSEVKTKLTVAEVYDRILEDCSDEYLEQLSKNSTNDTFDFEADFGYAVRAHVLFQMKRYDEAAAYAKKAIAVNPVIDDRSAIVNSGVWELPYDAPNHYMFIMSNYIINFSELGYQTLTPEFVSLFEEGDYLRYYSDINEWYDYDEMLVGAPGSMYYVGSGSPRINVWGLRSEQVYYILAEALIRTGHIDDGLDYVDQVRRNRIHPSKFTAYKGSVSSEKDAMALLIPAKRVECVMTIENYLDCKRRNSEPAYAADVLIDNVEYGFSAIKPGSKLWIFPFPMNATNFNPTLTQNI